MFLLLFYHLPSMPLSKKPMSSWYMHVNHSYFSLHTHQGVRIESVPGSVEQMIEKKLNGTVSLICRHKTAARTDMELVWLRNNALVKLENNNRGDNSSICVTPLTHEDNGAIFTCQRKNDTTLNDSVTLNVTCKSHMELLKSSVYSMLFRIMSHLFWIMSLFCLILL